MDCWQWHDAATHRFASLRKLRHPQAEAQTCCIERAVYRGHRRRRGTCARLSEPLWTPPDALIALMPISWLHMHG
jgi:hypothetical protein